MKALLHAVWAGTCAGAAIRTALTFMLALNGLAGGQGVLSMLWLGILPLLLTVPFVLVGALGIGLALTALLQKTGRETRTAYVVAGAVVGFLLPLLFSSANSTDVWWPGSFLGILSGSVTANVWWKHRSRPKLNRRSP
jgi:hypothetical protein